MFTPKQVYETLTISPSTLRRWANRFEEYISIEENRKSGTHREYTPEDLNVFRAIQTNLDNGLTYAEIEKRLAVVDEPKPEPSTALATLPEITQAIETALAAAASMRLANEEYQTWKIEYNAWAGLPWWKRMFTPPPAIPESPPTPPENPE